MKNCIITFRSVTPAQRAEDYLHRAGVDCTLQRTPKWMEEKGCGYSIRFDDNLKSTVEQAALELGINIRAFYSEKTVDGKRKYFKEI